MKILVINGVNLNKLGTRTKEYGTFTLKELEAEVAKECALLGIESEFFSSNIEGEIVNAIQNTDADAIVINAGAYTHYSIAIADALRDKRCRKIEVHLTNIFDREEFRNKSVISAATDGVIAGFGIGSYLLAVRAATLEK